MWRLKWLRYWSIETLLSFRVFLIETTVGSITHFSGWGSVWGYCKEFTHLWMILHSMLWFNSYPLLLINVARYICQQVAKEKLWWNGCYLDQRKHYDHLFVKMTVFIQFHFIFVNFEHISHFVLVFLLFTLIR